MSFPKHLSSSCRLVSPSSVTFDYEVGSKANQTEASFHQKSEKLKLTHMLHFFFDIEAIALADAAF